MKMHFYRMFRSGARPDLRSARSCGTAGRLPTAPPCRMRDQAASPAAAWFPLVLMVSILAGAVGCGKEKVDPNAGAPPKPKVEEELNANNFRVDRPELFPLVTAVEHKSVPALDVTGVVQPDIARSVPVVSLATGRVVEIKARLGDVVEKGQLLLRVQSNDISGAFQTYIKAQNDERLARTQYERAQLLYDKGAIAKSALEQAEDAEADAKADLNAANEQLRLLGIDKEHPSGIVNIVAPISGVITDQQVTNASGVQGLSGPSPFTVADLSYVWIVCDVFENDLDAVHMGEFADVRLNAFPNQPLKGRIDNILPILDPNIRTAKVRIEVKNPGMLRIGMFATATFYGKQPVMHAAIPASAILHLHDREWVYTPLGEGRFRRAEVATGRMLPNGQQEVVSGLNPGSQVVANALALQNTVEQ
jgi:membrane fusion protein, heavy metal efflux system